MCIVSRYPWWACNQGQIRESKILLKSEPKTQTNSLKIIPISKKVVSTPPYKTTPRGGGMSGPFNIEESHETSELSCGLLNSTGFISDPTRKLVEVGKMGL